jgi:ribosomal-protein-serine acetyltransferase
VGNEPSQAIPRRLGFVMEGTLRHAQRLVDGHSDLRVFGLLAQEYRQALHEFERR